MGGHADLGLALSAHGLARLPRLAGEIEGMAVEVKGEAVQLTYLEFELLRTLAANPGRVYTRQALLKALWGGSEYRDPRTIDVHVRHLREKIEPDPGSPSYLFTVRGVGYRFREAP